MTRALIEVVIDSVHSAIASAEGGADRLELCDNLFEGGTTPSAGTIEVVRSQVNINLYIMIRPRGGDFLYSSLEFDIMKKDILVAKELGADGVVFGILNKEGEVDMVRCNELIALAKPMDVTFHRAFDMTNNPYKALEDLIELKVARVLTSGHERSALEGADLIKELVDLASDKIIVMPGGGINERNLSKLQQITNAREFHVSARSKTKSKMIFRKSNVYMGGELRLEEYSNSFADAGKIQSLVNHVKK